MKKKLLRAALAVWVLGAALGVAARQGLPAYATETKSEKDEDEEDEADKALREEEERLDQQKKDTLHKIDAIKTDIKTVESEISKLKSAKSSLQTYINRLDAQSNTLEKQIQELTEQIELQTEQIRKKEEQIQESEEQRQYQYEMMKKRICYMYENSTDSFLTMLLESESLSEMMNRVEYALQISEYDQRMAQKMLETQQRIEEQKAQLEEEKVRQEELMSELDSQKAALNKAINAKSQEIAAYQSQINTASSTQGDYEAQLAQQEKLLDQIEAQIAAVAAAKAADGDGDGGASGFQWPCPASHRITSYFGPRTAPVPGASTYHKGIDIGASTGSAIIASASGRVTTATYSSSAGNYVVISHGNGISTVYMHASALYVSEGDLVSKGQTIAAVGSTGYSSGPHLHFGVVVGGDYVNPLNYVR